MRIALDTSGYSALMRGHEGVLDLIQRADQIAISTVVLGELLAGFRGGTRRAENLARLDQFRASPRVSSVAIDEETADRYSEIVAYLRRSGRPIPTNDIWIAASTMQHGLRLLTTDKDFAEVPQVAATVLDP